jgi:hypothetical protein
VALNTITITLTLTLTIKLFSLHCFSSRSDSQGMIRRQAEYRGHCILWRNTLNIRLPVQSASITTKIVSSNTAHGDVYSIQHYVIKFVCDLLQFPPPIKLTTTENSVESGIKHHILYLTLTLQERVCNNNEFFFAICMFKQYR